MTVAAVIQARMTSSRMPGKVLAPLGGKPLLQRLVERLRRARRLDHILIAATERVADDKIEALGLTIAAPVFRGSETDVLGRFKGAVDALASDAEVIVRVTSDCPLLDPEIVDDFVSCFQAGRRADYVWDGSPPQLPNGMSVEVFSREALNAAAIRADSAYDREHVTPFLRTAGHGFRMKTRPSAICEPDMRLCVDTEDDYAAVSAVYEALAPSNPQFSLYDVITLLKLRPDLAVLNAHVQQTTGTHAKAFDERLSA